MRFLCIPVHQAASDRLPPRAEFFLLDSELRARLLVKPSTAARHVTLAIRVRFCVEYAARPSILKTATYHETNEGIVSHSLGLLEDYL
jgi:hypothetical protein